MAKKSYIIGGVKYTLCPNCEVNFKEARFGLCWECAKGRTLKEKNQKEIELNINQNKNEKTNID